MKPRGRSRDTNERERCSVNRYYFNFRQGDELSCDHVGMYLPDLDAARAEALYVWREPVEAAQTTGDVPEDCELEIEDARHEPVLSIPLGRRTRLH